MARDYCILTAQEMGAEMPSNTVVNLYGIPLEDQAFISTVCSVCGQLNREHNFTCQEWLLAAEDYSTSLGGADPVFFRKEQLTIGTKLVYMGRTDPNSIWEVSKIHHNYYDVYSNIRHRNVKVPKTFLSLIFLRRISNAPPIKGRKKMGNRLELNFGYLSYSAIWRIAPW